MMASPQATHNTTRHNFKLSFLQTDNINILYFEQIPYHKTFLQLIQSSHASLKKKKKKKKKKNGKKKKMYYKRHKKFLTTTHLSHTITPTTPQKKKKKKKKKNQWKTPILVFSTA
jgi:hypothetical protein